MNKNDLKKFVTKILLEKLHNSPKVEGKLVKKTLSFRGIKRECVCEGTTEQANDYAKKHNLTFTSDKNSAFGGHFNGEFASFEFHPNAEYYGELMETSMSAREQLSRICGTNDQILTEVDAQNSENLVEFICKNKSFCENKTDMVFEQIKNNIHNRLYDKTQYTKLFEYLVKQSCKMYAEEEIKLSESEMEYTTKLLSKRFFEDNNTNEVLDKESKSKNAFENMQRIKSGHQMFL